MTGDIGLFYGSTTCYTEMAAEKIRDAMGTNIAGTSRVDLFDIANQPIALANAYQQVILGIPTWDYGELEESWENIWEDIDQVNWRDKSVALYGLGDQLGYPDWFQDAMGYLAARITSLGARCVGQWPTTGYRFTGSQGLTKDGDYFVGLALDDENDFELSDARILRWCRQVSDEFEM